MLLERYRQLLTALIDGELTNRQRRHVERLLQRSAEARQLLQQMRDDVRALRHLPPPPMPVDLSGKVLRTIAERRLTPGQRRIARTRNAASWVGPLGAWAAAAAVLLVLGAASYLYFAASLAHPITSDLARNQPENPSPVAAPEKPNSSDVARGESPPSSPLVKPMPDSGNGAAATPPQVVKGPDDQPKKPVPDKPPSPPKDETLLTDRLEMFRLSKVEAILPIVLKVRDLDQEAVRKNLIAELGKDSNFRLELPCHNGTKAFERVQAVAKKMDLGLAIDKRAQDRLRLPQWQTNYVVYLENLTPEELARMVQQIGAEDKSRAARKPGDSQFDRLVLTRMTPEDHKELSTLLGVDPTAADPTPKGPLGADPRKPLSDLTAQQIGQALAGQGGTPRPQAGKPGAKVSERLALVLAFNPVRPSPGSAEIKRFLNARKPLKPGTIRVLLVLRG